MKRYRERTSSAGAKTERAGVELLARALLTDRDRHLAFAPKGFTSFRMAMPIWLKEKLFQKSLLSKELRKIDPKWKTPAKLLFAEHHARVKRIQDQQWQHKHAMLHQIHRITTFASLFHIRIAHCGR